MHIEIRKITINDLGKLQAISRQTFYESFSAMNSEENMQKYLDEGFSKEKLTAEINNPFSEFYFPTHDDNVMGYLKINFGEAQTEMKDKNSLEVERIYILHEYQGMKVGQLLFDKVLQIAKERRIEFVWLGVWEENTRAINFYKRNGFVEFNKHVFRLGKDEQTDVMMRLGL